MIMIDTEMSVWPSGVHRNMTIRLLTAGDAALRACEGEGSALPGALDDAPVGVKDMYGRDADRLHQVL